MCVFCKGQSSNGKLSEKDVKKLKVETSLREISGLALSKNGRLFAHNDERAVIYEINPSTGESIKYFYLGILIKRGDFEDIEIVGDDFYLVTSEGLIYKFKEGKNEEKVEYIVLKTGLNKKNNVEGLCYDPTNNSLLLALKGNPINGINKKDYKVVMSFSLDTKKLIPQPRFLLKRK